jgi:tRNA threonylcarbamoyladenosine biosynthesis protein TsaE
MTTTLASGVTITLRSAECAVALAQRFKRLAAPGLCILLSGPVGAGKTTFARALIQHLQTEHGTAEDIPSPTFTLVQTYHAGTLEIWHADLYRLTSPDELIELGLDDALDSALCLIEWPDRMGDLTPKDAVHLDLQPTAIDDERLCTLRCANPAIQSELTALAQGLHDD